MSDDLKNKYTDSYASYMKHLEECVFDKETQENMPKKENIKNEVQTVFPRESEKE
jgi:predicted RNA-binding protein with PIN domain